ncbi:MFS transporter [Bacillus sp. ISL-78]|nr:MFS transporter [Bacillus sp. ISL-78]MBT2627761.1 MFS transporter [Bacillus sp. ISL-101]
MAIGGRKVSNSEHENPLETNIKTLIHKRKIGMRWWLGIIFIFIGLVSYMDRANMSVVAVPMMKELNMNKVQFGFLASSFFLGYALFQIPSGIISEKFGVRRIITFAMIWWSIFTALTAAFSSYIFLSLVRFLFGVGEAPLAPANAVFNSFWFQKQEKGRAVSLLLVGQFFGPVIAPGISVALLAAFGWRSVFYLFAIPGIVISIFWYIVSRDKPEMHSWVSEYEKNLILTNRDISNADHKRTPWKDFLGNTQFWAVGLQYFIVVYMTTLFITWLPTYLIEARHFSLTKMGVAASFPFLAICLLMLAGGVISDYLIQKGKSLMVARGGLAITGLIIFIITINLASLTNNPFLNVLWLTIALGSLGLPVVQSWAVANDLGKQFAGSVSGWMNFWGNIGAVLSPIICGWTAQQMGWNIALMINSVPVLFAAVIWFFIKPDKQLVK